MEELEIQGKKYISSKRASVLTKYAKDYIGQLARSGKVPATRVGRAWYVELNAIQKHAFGTNEEDGISSHKNTILNPAISEDISSPLFNAKETSSRISLNSLQRPGIHPKGTGTLLKTWSDIQYFPDSSVLLPSVSREERPHVVQMRKTVQETANYVENKSLNISRLNEMPLKLSNDILNTNTIQKQTNHTHKTRPIPHIGYAAIFLILSVFVIIGGLYAPSEWSFSSPYLAQVSSAGSLEIISSYLFDIFDQGINLIKLFLSALILSFGDFFEAGLIYLINLFNNINLG